MSARRLRKARRTAQESFLETQRLKLGDKDGRVNLLGLTKSNLRNILKEILPKEPSERILQIWNGIYKRRYSSFSQFSLSESVRETLEKELTLDPGRVMHLQRSQDGTAKWLTSLRKGGAVESVFMPDDKHDTLCVSSQVGCALTCSFCHTGAQSKENLRNLAADEIIGQIVNAKRLFSDDDSPEAQKRMKPNIVFMGQGEPLLNYSNLKSAIEILLDSEGLNFGRRRVTVSTSGVVPVIHKMVEDGIDVELAISLHAPNDELRNQLVPLNKTYDLQSLISAALDYSDSISQKYISFEYVMLSNVNDTLEHARELCILLKPLRSVVINLIPWNPWDGSNYQSSSNNRIHTFRREILKESKNKFIVTIRKNRGRDIMAACGQLNTSVANSSNIL